MNTASRYWHTLRHMRPVQFYGRFWFRWRRPSVRPGDTPPLRAHANWVTPARRSPSLIAPGTFRLLNQEALLAECGWDDPARDKLWRYNQHYFDDLNAFGSEERWEWQHALIRDWLAQNPPGHGTAWEPYPTSLRIVNWAKWALGGTVLSEEALASHALQARWLTKRLEWHLLGNHLLANAKALIFAGLLFEGNEASRWLAIGTRIATAQLPEQILSDGGQFELSPMYHALAVEDVLDLFNILSAFDHALGKHQKALLEICRARIPIMRAWLANMSHLDGGISFFNDAAFGIAPSNAELDMYAMRLGFPALGAPPPLWFGESGYARLSAGDGLLIADMAAVGPSYLPGHAHADTLSFEFSLKSQRIFVNSGTSVYGVSAERLRQRGTAAHNCVIVDGADSSDVWSGFRVGLRARVSGASVRRSGGVFMAEARHDGYRKRPDTPKHHRKWQLQRDCLIIEDSITAPVTSAEARYHLFPDVRVVQHSPTQGTLVCADGRELAWMSATPAMIESSTWHPEFGISEASNCLIVTVADGHARLTVSWDQI